MATRDIYIPITKDCIHNCIFCSFPKEEKYLSFQEVKNKIDQYKKLNYTDINLTGGEPTLHPELQKIIRYGVKQGFSVRMTSNGVRLADPKLMKSIVDAGLSRILFSIHHYDPHEAMIICGVDEPDLKETIKGLNNANNLGIDININITIIKQNYKALPNIISMLIPRFKNIHHFNFNFVDITGNVIRKGAEFTAKDIAPKYSDAEKYLVSAFKMLKKNKVLFRFERAPLCYAPGFEAYNSNANRAVGMEFHATSSIEQDIPDIDDNDVGMVKSGFCKYCNLNDICFGIEPNYNKLYGNKELYPIFANPNRVEFEIKKQNNHKEPISFMEIEDINEGVLESLFNRFGGVKALIRKGERHIINLMLPEKQNLGEAHLEVIRSLLNLLREQGFDLSDFQILSKKKQEPIIKTLQEKYKIGLIAPGTFVPKSVYDSMVINSIMLPKETKESYGIINIIASEPFQETIFLGFADLITSKMKDKLKLLSRRKYFNALLDIYSTLKPKIKSNINLIRGTENNGMGRYISLSRDFSVQEYLNEKVFKKNKVILDFVSERKLGPQNISRIDFDSLRKNRSGELPFQMI